MKVLRNVIKILLITALALLVVLNLFQLASQALNKKDLPMLCGFSWLAVLTGSMEPAISAGDMIIIRRESGYAPGDIITFRDGGSYTTHRITETMPGGFRTKGDANNTEDSSSVLPEQIAGRVILVIPGMGKVFLFLRTPGGMLLLLLAGGLALYAAERAGKKEKRCAE